MNSNATKSEAKMPRTMRSVSLALGIVVIAAAAHAQQLFVFQQGRAGYTGTRDSHIFINKPNNNAGGEIMFEASGNGGAADAKHALIRFDLSSLPTTLQIDSAWVAFYFTQTRTPLLGDKTLGIFRMNRPWGEGSGDDPGGFDGRLAQSGEANWFHAFFNTLAWTVPGANGIPTDHEAQAESERTFSPVFLKTGWMEWPNTQMVQFWMAHPDSNFGFTLRETTISPQTGIIDFASSEHPDSTVRPMLYVQIGALTRTIVQMVSESHTANSITVTAQILGDENQNATATLAYREATSWSAEQTMQRGGNKFISTITGLIPETTYDVRVTFGDADGVEGTNPFILSDIRLPRLTGFLNFSHLDFLTEPIVLNGDSMAIVHLYSNYPDYQWVGDEDEGIAAVDDAARAAVAYLRHFEKFNDEHSRRQAKLLLHFLFYMQADDGGFYNFIWPDYSINRTGSTSNNDGFNWWAGRAVWAMGYARKIFSEKNIELSLQQQLNERLDRAIAKAKTFVTAANSFQVRYGFRVPASGWLLGDGADFSAEMALGLAYYYQSSQNNAARTLLEKLCDGIAACQLGDAASFPFGLFLSAPNDIHHWHAWGSRQLMALAVAGKTLQRQDWINAAKKAADNFYLHLLTSEILAEVNPSLVVYSAEAGQINYGTASTVEGLIELYHTTAEAQYAQWAGLFGSWWLGNNVAQFAMYDSTTGRCFDGIDPGRVNLNSGGESVAEGLMGLQAAYFVDAARPLLFYREQNRHAYRIVEAETFSEVVSGHPFVSNSTTYGPAHVSNSRYLELRNGDTVRYRVTADNTAAVNEEYYLYLQFGWQSGVADAVGISIEVDGIPQSHAQGGASATFLWVAQLPQKIPLAAGHHEIMVRYAGSDPQRTAIVDYVMLQPAVQRKIFINANNDSFVVERRIPSVTAVTEPSLSSTTPVPFTFSPNYPNPFHNQTTLSFGLPQAQEVTIRVINLLGQEVAVLQRGKMAAGRHHMTWDAHVVPSGIYVIVLEAGATRLLTKAVVLH